MIKSYSKIYSDTIGPNSGIILRLKLFGYHLLKSTPRWALVPMVYPQARTMEHSTAITLPLHPGLQFVFPRRQTISVSDTSIMAGDSAVVVKTRKFKKNPLLARKQVGSRPRWLWGFQWSTM